MKTLYLMGLILLPFLFMSLPSVSGNADSALDQSISLSQKLGGRERRFYLMELCNISSRLGASKQQINQWSKDLFQVGSEQQDLLARAVAQKNSVSCLVNIDPQAAMNLITEIEFHRPDEGQWTTEDPRFNAVDAAFKSYLDQVKPPNISEVIKKAKYIGSTGQYPYTAMANVIKRKPGPSEDEINTILNDALNFYTHETGFYNRDEEFRNLLRALDLSMNKELTSQLVESYVLRLTNNPLQFPGDYYSEVHITSSGKVFPFSDRNAAFMFQDFPTIRRFNPELAAKLSHDDSQLTHATDKMDYIPGGFIQGNPTSDEAAEEHVKWLQVSLLKRIQTIRERTDCDPEAAAHIAQRLSDPSLRVIGFAKAVPAIAKVNHSEAQGIFEKQLSELTDLEDLSAGKLKAMVELAQAAQSLDESDQYEALSTQAFDVGLKLFNSDNKSRVQRQDGFSELRDLVMFSASQPKDILQTEVNALPDGWLKAYLWLYQAEARSKRNMPEPASGPCPD